MDLYHGGATRMSRILRTLWLALVLALLVPATAWAGKRSMIPPGHEAEVRELIERALGSEPRPGFAIERDRIRVSLGPAGPRFVLFHPQVEPHGELGDALAPSIIVSCGPAAGPHACSEHERAHERPRAEALARERDRLADTIWTIEDTGVASRPVVEDEALAPARERLLDRVVFVLGLLGGLVALGSEARGDRGERRLARFEWLALLALLGVFVAGSLLAVSPWPLHEHNSFVARADCAVDDRCVDDPVGAWGPTSLHVQGLVLIGFGLGQLGPWLSWLSHVGFVTSLVVIVLAWGLARRLVFALGLPQHARLAALAGAGLLCLHPVHWRLAMAASFWPLALLGVLAAALAGLWASEREHAPTRLLGWSVAAIAFALACGGNLVLLTLVPLALLAPACWTQHGFARQALARAGLLALPSLALLGVLLASDVRYGWLRASESLAPTLEWRELLHVRPLVLDARVTALPWLVLALASLAWLFARARSRVAVQPRLHPLRLLAPIAWAWVVPQMRLGLAAGDLLGHGYPVGFLNHHWELVLSSLGVALGSAWLLALADAHVPALRSARARSLALAGTLALALVLAPLAHVGWTMARGVLVVERELAALQAHLPELPEHDRLVVAPRVLEPLAGVERVGDAIEVVFPLHAYAQAMQARGRTPAPVDDLDGLARIPPDPDERVLLYVGTSLRSFQPQEIAADRVPGSLERPALTELRERFELEPALTFEIATAQHEAVSMRLAADRVPSVELGFYWLRRRAAKAPR